MPAGLSTTTSPAGEASVIYPEEPRNEASRRVDPEEPRNEASRRVDPEEPRNEASRRVDPEEPRNEASRRVDPEEPRNEASGNLARIRRPDRARSACGKGPRPLRTPRPQLPRPR